MSRVLRLSEQQAAIHIWSTSTDRQQTRQLECGGDGTGSMWLATPDTVATRFPYAHWRLATRYRLALTLAPPAAACCVPRADHTPCDMQIDPWGDHQLVCKAGPARLRPHKALQHKLGQLLTASGADVDYERPVPDMYRLRADGTVQEEILDLVATYPAIVGYWAIDVSIRAPQAARSADTNTRCGVPSTAGAAEKARRYGCDVLPLFYEPGGRLGTAGIDSLRVMATAAAAAGRHTGGRPLWQLWRTQLECALLFAVADVFLLGLGHGASTMCPGRRLAPTAGTTHGARQARAAREELHGPAAEAEALLGDPRRLSADPAGRVHSIACSSSEPAAVRCVGSLAAGATLARLESPSSAGAVGAGMETTARGHEAVRSTASSARLPLALGGRLAGAGAVAGADAPA